MKRYLLLLLAASLIATSFACAPAESAAQRTSAPVTIVATEAPAQNEAPLDNADNVDYAALSNILLRIFTDYLPGTAGCSLQAAKLAGELLDWNALHAPEIGALTAAMQETVQSLPPDAKAQYAEQFYGVKNAAGELLQDNALDYLESAGYSPTAYPYASEDVETLFAALNAGIQNDMATSENGAFLKKAGDAAAISLDIDGDGVPETATVTVDEDKYTTDVTIVGANQSYSDHMDNALMFLSAYTCDAWQGNGSQALILCGDEASDDYETVIYRVTGGKLERAEIFGSLTDADASGILTIERSVDVFGTYGGTCRYMLTDGFAFSLSSPYTVNGNDNGRNDRKLTVICDSLPVILQDGTSAAATLPKGTELMLVETDQESYAVLADDNSVYYRVDIARRADDWQWYLNGVPEDECFTPLLYAG